MSSKPHDATAGDNVVLRARAEIQRLGLGLVLLLLTAKVLLLPFPVTTAGEFVRYLLRLAIVAAPDLCFAEELTACAWASCRWWTSLPLRRMARPACFLLFFAAGLYGAASVPIFQWTKAPLTLPVLMFAGGTTKMASSVSACIGWGTLAGLLIAPLAMFVLARMLQRVRRGPLVRPLSWRAVALLLCLTSAYGIACRSYVHARWTDPNRWERRIAVSPHLVFASSCLKQVFSPGFSAAFAEGDDRDFRSPKSSDAPDVFAGQAGIRPKNVVLIVLESTSAEYLELYGGRWQTMPHLAHLAAERGVVFENMYVQTPSSCNSLVAYTNGVLARLDWTLIVRDSPEFSVPSLPKVMAENGYRTCFAHAGYWSWKDRDAYLRRCGVEKIIDADTVPAAAVNSWGIADRDMFQATLDWVDSDQQPFFLLAYTIETHHPYVARAPLADFGVDDEEFNRYLNALRAADETVAWFIEELDRRGLTDSTLIAVTSDNGESFGQHNQRIHSFCIYEPAVHVPLVLIHPALKDHPRRVAGVRQQVDIPYTLTQMLGIKPPQVWQGDHLFRKQGNDHAYFYAIGNEVILGMRDGPWKYHYYVDSGLEELFHVASDSAELKNVSSLHTAKCTDFKRRLGGMVNFQREFLSRMGSH